MTDYSDMSVDELLDEMDSDVVEGCARDAEKVSALRNAILREERRANDDRMGYSGH